MSICASHSTQNPLQNNVQKDSSLWASGGRHSPKSGGCSIFLILVLSITTHRDAYQIQVQTQMQR